MKNNFSCKKVLLIFFFASFLYIFSAFASLISKSLHIHFHCYEIYSKIRMNTHKKMRWKKEIIPKISFTNNLHASYASLILFFPYFHGILLRFPFLHNFFVVHVIFIYNFIYIFLK
jgi:hypothetical protein